MPIIQVTDLSAPELAAFSRLTEAQLRNRLEPEKGIFIAESPKVIARALDAGLQPVSLLMEPRHIAGDARDIIARCGDIPVYTAPREVLSALTGYALTRGVLCAMRRPLLLPVEQVCAEARRVPCGFRTDNRRWIPCRGRIAPGSWRARRAVRHRRTAPCTGRVFRG